MPIRRFYMEHSRWSQNTRLLESSTLPELDVPLERAKMSHHVVRVEIVEIGQGSPLGDHSSYYFRHRLLLPVLLNWSLEVSGQIERLGEAQVVVVLDHILNRLDMGPAKTRDDVRVLGWNHKTVEVGHVAF